MRSSCLAFVVVVGLAAPGAADEKPVQKRSQAMAPAACSSLGEPEVKGFGSACFAASADCKADGSANVEAARTDAADTCRDICRPGQCPAGQECSPSGTPAGQETTETNPSVFCDDPAKPKHCVTALKRSCDCSCS
jgi:hypothetical protein